MNEHCLSETCIWWLNGWKETLLLLKEKMETKALLGRSWHLSQEHFSRGSAVHCKPLQHKARLRNISGYQNTLSQAGVILCLEGVRKHPMHRQGRSPQGLHPAVSVHCSWGRIAALLEHWWTYLGDNGVLPFFSSWGYGLRGNGGMHMTNEAGREGGHFWYKRSLDFTKFSIKKKKKKKGGKQRDEGKLPTDYQCK